MRSAQPRFVNGYVARPPSHRPNSSALLSRRRPLHARRPLGVVRRWRARLVVVPCIRRRCDALPITFACREVSSGASTGRGIVVAAAASPAAAGSAPFVATAANLLGVPRVQFDADSPWLRHAAIAAEILLRTWGLMMARICEITSASMPTGIPFPQSLYAAVSSTTSSGS